MKSLQEQMFEEWNTKEIFEQARSYAYQYMDGSQEMSGATRLQTPSLGNEKPIPKLPGRHRHEVFEIAKASGGGRIQGQGSGSCGSVSASSFCGVGFKVWG